MSIAGSILQLVEEAAQREPFRRVRELHLMVLTLSCVEAGALRFALESIAPGTLLEGAELAIDEARGRGRCRECGRESEMTDRWQACADCGAGGLVVTAGSELKLVDMLVE
ncbi:hydrogenase maturation nickel metallochaperone HypA [Piscinibacter sakaiensis]|uniref:hydrogenase maturation nickel metallochaperone HypA/HybF n=1 Tax=Piscinibacter sakaiensis TaxID=1547922 RepID=UPI003AAAD83A